MSLTGVVYKLRAADFRRHLKKHERSNEEATNCIDAHELTSAHFVRTKLAMERGLFKSVERQRHVKVPVKRASDSNVRRSRPYLTPVKRAPSVSSDYSSKSLQSMASLLT